MIPLNEVSEVIHLMNDTFDSHEFLYEYKRKFPKSYNRLVDNSDVNSAHGVIAMYLGNHAPTLGIYKIEDVSYESENTNGKFSRCARWQRVGIAEERLEEEKRRSTAGDNIAETILAVVAYLILFFGITSSIIIGYAIGSYSFDREWIGWTISLIGIAASFVVWASCMVVVNISNNVREIKRELRKS